MRRIVIVALFFVAVFAACVAAAGVLTVTASPAIAGPACRCPLIVDQVTCSNGKTYINLCFADCDHAKGCVRVGP
jgi:hypothetical protein